MSTFLYLQINIIGILLLIIMYVNVTQSHAGKNSIDQNLFKLLILSVIAIFVFDSGMWFIDGKTFTYAKAINYITTTIYLILNPVTCFFWLLYGKHKLSAETKFTIKHLQLYLIPVIINTILVIASIKTGWIFYIDEMNIYHRGDLMNFTAILPFSYFFIMSYIVLKQSRKKQSIISKEMYRYFFLFPIPPILGAIIQLLYYGVSLIWVGMLISTFIIFIHIQNKQIYKDSLTGLYNRRFFENQLRNPFMPTQKGKHLFTLMIDIDNFKTINDTYGHLSGDFALIEVANTLKAACIRNDYIVRYGGDEFFVLGYCSDKLHLQKKITTIENEIIQNNSQNDLPFSISISIGHSISTESERNTITALMKKADDSMYEVKKRKKNRPKSDSCNERVTSNCRPCQ
ncbi:GGDEF domain-containing protein [Bacillus massiliigorillae]|uniref:GGDEF domain-containing protein n=1 Tax=Bacillus massiliigorillae TaxID=1243664 RepID=UPI0003A9BBD5|nr:GGDEF domain-containing protein [Bacillus massiliigorillae]